MKRKPDPLTRIGLVANAGKSATFPLVQRAARLIAATGRTVLADGVTAGAAGLDVDLVPDTARLARACDLLLVFGGDGTMLRVSRELRGSRTPVLGVKVGGLGFLTTVQSEELAPVLERLWAGDHAVEARPLIAVSGNGRGVSIQQTALNDFVISRGVASRLIDLDVTIDGQPLTRYRCDGLIVSSPTGSTAYSLAAGGAIVSPDAEVLTLTPICPHTLTNRSVIVPLTAVVGVKVLSERVETTLTVDGQVPFPLDRGDQLFIRRSRHSLRLVRLAGHSFFDTLRQKLHWSGSNVDAPGF